MQSLIFSKNLVSGNGAVVADLGFGSGHGTAIGTPAAANINYGPQMDCFGADMLAVFISDSGIAAGVTLQFRIRWGSAGQDPNGIFGVANPIFDECSVVAGGAAGGVQQFTFNIAEYVYTVTPGTRTGRVLYVPVVQEYFQLGCWGNAPPAGQAVDVGIVLGRSVSFANVPNG